MQKIEFYFGHKMTIVTFCACTYEQTQQLPLTVACPIGVAKIRGVNKRVHC